MKSNLITFSLISFFCFSIFACSPSDLPKYTTVQGIRVLSLNLDQPEINFNGTTFTPSAVDLTPTVSDLYGGGRTLAYSVEWCLDPGIFLGATPTCIGNATRTVVAQAQSVATTATFLSPNYTGTLNSITIDLTAASAATKAIIGQAFLSAQPAQRYNGISLIVIYSFYAVQKPTDQVTAFKRIVLSDSTKAIKNQNPSGLQILLAGAEVTGLPASDVEMNAFIPANQAENYSEMNETGALTAKTERLETTWFFTGPADVKCANDKDCTTDGVFKLSRSLPGETNLFYAPRVSVPTARGRVLIGVARDNRGGNQVKRYCFGTCP